MSKEYVDLIEKKSSETRKRIEKESKQKIIAYRDAHRCHDEVLMRMWNQSEQIAKDNSKSFLVNDEIILFLTKISF